METVEERTGEPEQDYASSLDVGHEPAVPLLDEDDAVLVRVVGTPDPPETNVDWEAFPVAVGTNIIQIAGANRNRTRLFLRNINASGGDSVSLMPTGATAREFGYVLEAQDSVEFFHNGPVWAQCASGESATLAAFVEHVTT
jgi:hypothetical protein